MNDWYYIGENSIFDTDMFFTEMVINYHFRKNKKDVSSLYYHYISALNHYYGKFKDMLDNDLPINYIGDEYIETNLFFKSVKEKLDPRLTIQNFRNKTLKKFKKTTNKFNDIYDTKIKIIENSYSEKDFSLLDVKDLLIFISRLLCLDYNCIDVKIDDNGIIILKPVSEYKILDIKDNTIYPIVNNTGWFNYNSYMFALCKGLDFIGIPSGKSSFDGIVGCPSDFANHDIQHIELYRSARNSSINNLYKTYEYIFTQKYTKIEKEALIFTLWYIIHEKNLPIFFTDDFIVEINNIIYSHNYRIDFGMEIKDSNVRKDWTTKLIKGNYKMHKLVLDELQKNEKIISNSYLYPALAYAFSIPILTKYISTL